MKKLFVYLLWLLLNPVSGFADSPLSAEDGDAPLISDLDVSPGHGPIGTTYVITLKISDPQGNDDILPTLYQLREGMEIIVLSLSDNGDEGDVESGDGIYTATDTVPHGASSGKHGFEIFIEDRAGNRSNVLRYQFTVEELIEARLSLL